MKVCPKCKIQLKDTFFDKRKEGGLVAYCKLCRKSYFIEYRKKHKEKIKLNNIIYKQKNRELIKKQKAQYYIDNKERITTKHRIYYKKHRYQLSLHKKQYRNTDKIRNHKKEYEKYQHKNNPQYKLKKLLRNRIQTALKVQGSNKTGSAVRDLGISIPEFKAYIESMFRDSMTWENHGKVWHLDHIKPLSSFDLSDKEQFLIAANWKNYQPLLTKENLSKGCRLN